MKDLGNRIYLLRKQAGLSQSELAGKLNLSQSALSHIENGRVNISLEILIRCCELLNTTVDRIIYENTSVDQVHAGHPVKECILVDRAAQASYASDFSDEEYLDGLKRYLIPGFESANFRVFEVVGDSMRPLILKGEFLITKRSDLSFDEAVNCLCVVISEQGVMVKRLTSGSDSESFILHSENPAYDDITLNADEILELWTVVGKITSHVDSPSSHLDSLVSRIEALENIIYNKK